MSGCEIAPSESWAALLSKLGCTVTYTSKPGCPPLRISPPATPLPAPPIIEIPTTQSSQFISGLLMCAPWLARGLTVRLMGEITSAPYIAMTLGLLARVGASVRSSEDLHVIRVGPAPSTDDHAPSRGLNSFDYSVEPDATGATYFGRPRAWSTAPAAGCWGWMKRRFREMPAFRKCSG